MLFAFVDLTEELDEDVGNNARVRDVGHQAVHASRAFFSPGPCCHETGGLSNFTRDTEKSS